MPDRIRSRMDASLEQCAKPSFFFPAHMRPFSCIPLPCRMVVPNLNLLQGILHDMDNAKAFIWFVCGIAVIVLPDLIPSLSHDTAGVLRVIGAFIIGAKCLLRL